VVAVQFHPEVDEAIIQAWYAMSDPPPSYPVATALAGVARSGDQASRLLDAFCTLVATPGGAPSPNGQAAGP
jgi:hypothetical protein